MSDNHLQNNHLQDAPDSTPNNWDDFRSLFLGQPIPTTAEDNTNLPSPTDNWDTLQQLFELTSPALLPSAQDPAPAIVDHTPSPPVTQKLLFSAPAFPQSAPSQLTPWFAQSARNQSLRSATLIDTLRHHANAAQLTHTQMRISQPSTPTPPGRVDRERNVARPNTIKQNGIKALLVAGFIFPYVVLLPTIGLLVGKMMPSLSSSTHPSPQPVVVYLTPTNAGEWTDGKKLSLSIPGGTAIVIQPRVSQEPQNTTAPTNPQLSRQLTFAVP
jgi:hypothetical protein